VDVSKYLDGRIAPHDDGLLLQYLFGFVAQAVDDFAAEREAAVLVGLPVFGFEQFLDHYVVYVVLIDLEMLEIFTFVLAVAFVEFLVDFTEVI